MRLLSTCILLVLFTKVLIRTRHAEQEQLLICLLYTSGWGLGKAGEVTAAIAKGVEAAKKNLTRVPVLKGDVYKRQIVSGPIPLPTHKRIFTVNRSTFVNKKSRRCV